MLVLIVLSVVSVTAYKILPVFVTPLIVNRSADQLRDSERDFRLKKDWVSLEDVSINMVKAVITSEDQNFMAHRGFDFVAIEKAIAHNKVNKKKVGASTITQQTAKNVFLWHGRNWVRKGMEAYFTLLIETIWSKDRILEVYLNVIEFGDGIYGVEAASQHFYNKPAAKLTKSEAAMLAAILPAPLKFDPLKPSKLLNQRKARIMRQMANINYPISEASYTSSN